MLEMIMGFLVVALMITGLTVIVLLWLCRRAAESIGKCVELLAEDVATLEGLVPSNHNDARK